MIGIINQAFEAFVVDRLGAGVWARATQSAGLADMDVFASTAYPDEITYRLLSSVCEDVDIAPDDALEAFGRFWIGFARTKGFGPLIDASGTTLAEALMGLEDLHSRVALAFPGSDLPRFTVEHETPESLTLRYRSRRPHLGPFVLGTLAGLAADLGVEADMSRRVLPPSTEFVEEIFEVVWRNDPADR